VYHDRALPADASTLQNCWARISLLLRGTSCKTSSPSACAIDFANQTRSAAQAAIVNYNAQDGSYSVRLHPTPDGGPELYVARTLFPDTTIAREVDGSAMSFPSLEINGTAVKF
jgi:hypothetical protein